MTRLLTAQQVKARSRTLKHRKPDVSIFTDASAFQKTQSSGWGGWAKGDRRKTVIKAGRAPYHKNTGLIELYAIVSMVEELFESEYLECTDKSVIIQSDSVTALGYVLNAFQYSVPSYLPGSANLKPMLPPAEGMAMLGRMHDFLQLMDIIYVRHVKSHQSKETTTRHGVNNLCDIKAKEKAGLGPMEVPEWLKSSWPK